MSWSVCVTHKHMSVHHTHLTDVSSPVPGQTYTVYFFETLGTCTHGRPDSSRRINCTHTYGTSVTNKALTNSPKTRTKSVDTPTYTSEVPLTTDDCDTRDP